MLTQRRANIVFAIVALLAAVFLAVQAFGFEDNVLLGKSQLSSRFFPLTALSFIIVCALVVLIQLIGLPIEDPAGTKPVYGHWRESFRGAMTFLVAVACFLVWTYVGFVPMALIVGPACALVMGVRSVWVYVFLIASGFAIYLVFSQLLGVEL